MLKEYFNYSMGEAVETVETVRASISVSIIHSFTRWPIPFPKSPPRFAHLISSYNTLRPDQDYNIYKSCVSIARQEHVFTPLLQVSYIK